jgi:glycosyltransferase involved in cell wall biosynthesis
MLAWRETRRFNAYGMRNRMTNVDEIKCVVHVIYSGLGGHSAVMLGLLNAGFFAGADHLVLLAGVEPPLPDTVERLERRRITWRYVPKLPGRGHVAFYQTLRREIFMANPSVVFVHGLAAVPSVVLHWSKAVVLVRETEAAKSIKDWGVLAVAHASADAVVHLTEDAAQTATVKLRLLQRPGKVHIIGNGLDVDFFSPAPRGNAGLLAASPLRLGMVARLQPNKDHFTLIAAFARLCECRPQLNAMLEIAGDGSTRPALAAEIARRGLEDRVVLHGTLCAEGVRDLLRRLDIYVHATLGETMSNSIMQAMAVGLPVIASDVSGVTNMVTPDLGRLYASRDADALFAAICDWLDDPEAARRHGAAARAHALAHFDATQTARAYEALAIRLAQGKSA